MTNASLSNFHVILKNATKFIQRLNWIKRFYRAKQRQRFGDKLQDCKGVSGLLLIKFYFVTGSQEFKTAILVEF